MEKFKQIKF